MSNDKSPAFQFYPSDFLSDLNTMVMSTEEIGAYWLLICVCWKENGLPKELKKLSQLARLQEKKFTRLWNENISRCFYFDEINQKFRHARLDKELQIQEDNRKRKIAAASKRWCKTDAPASETDAEPMQVQCPSSSSSSSSSNTSSTSSSVSQSTRAREPAVDDDFLKAKPQNGKLAKSRFDEALVLEFVTFSAANGRGITNPGGLARSLYQTGKSDWEIQAWLDSGKKLPSAKPKGRAARL